MEPEIKDPERPVEPAKTQGIVEFDDVTFYYPGAEVPALSISRSPPSPARSPQLSAVSVRANRPWRASLLRFYDVTYGQYPGRRRRCAALSQEDLRRRIGYVPQKALLFSGISRENLHYGKPEATDEEMRHAAGFGAGRRVHRRLEDGYDAFIAQGGANLSGGQRQRLTIARALVRRPCIYVFDDNFSALDFKTDAKVRAALQRETAEATVIIVAQRVSTIMDAAQIIVLTKAKSSGSAPTRSCSGPAIFTGRSSLPSFPRRRSHEQHQRQHRQQTARRPGSLAPARGGPHGMTMPVEKAKDFKGTLKRLLSYLRPHMAASDLRRLLAAASTLL